MRRPLSNPASRLAPLASAHTSLAALALGLAACAADPAAPEGQRVAVAVAPLKLEGITDASYTLTTTNAAGDVVWTQTGLTSQRYGDGAGALSYVGTCDASSNPNTVTLTLDSLSDQSGVVDADTWRNPGPLTRAVTCAENADVAVDFDLVVMRDAQQGFFDVAVNFDDVFCSAKLDCLPNGLLHNPATDERDTTVVFGFACTAGPGEKTTLYLSDLTVTCDGGTYTVDPSQGPGNLGGQAPLLFQVATYGGKEQLPDLDKCFWNTALGLDLAVLAPNDSNCKLTATGTAASQPFGDKTTPAGTHWPIITWSVDLTDASGALVCGANPLDGAGSGVVTGYTDDLPVTFAHERACTPGLQCTGTAPSLGSDAVLFNQVDGGFTVEVGGTPSDKVFPLPPGLTLNACCVDACCTAP